MHRDIKKNFRHAWSVSRCEIDPMRGCTNPWLRKDSTTKQGRWILRSGKLAISRASLCLPAGADPTEADGRKNNCPYADDRKLLSLAPKSTFFSLNLRTKLHLDFSQSKIRRFLDKLESNYCWIIKKCSIYLFLWFVAFPFDLKNKNHGKYFSSSLIK